MSELGDLLELLNTSIERWRTLRAEGREWRSAGLLHEAWQLALGERNRGRSVTFGAAVPPEPEEVEEGWRLWVERPDWIRTEFSVGGLETVTAVIQGPTWWSWSPSQGARTNGGDARSSHGLGPGEALLEPARLLPAADLTVRGRGTHLGRSVLLVEARPARIELDDEDLGPDVGLHRLGMGADEYQLIVDAERGLLLRSEAKIHGLPFRILEMELVSLDEDLPEDTFRSVAPGEEPFTVDEVGRSLFLAEAPQAVSFAIFVPERPPEGSVDVTLEPAHLRWGTAGYLEISYGHRGPESEDPPHQFWIRESDRPLPEPGNIQWRRVEEVEVAEDRNVRPVMFRLRLVKEATHIELSSYDLNSDRLLAITRSLVSLPAEPPGLRPSGD
jgi:hypothetical protein